MTWQRAIGRALRWLDANLPRRKSLSEEEWGRCMEPFIRRYAPRRSAEKYPPLLLLHGCAGDFPHLEHWARLLAEEGYLVYAIDSLTPRNIRPWQAHCLVCTGLRLRGQERSRDISAAISLICRDTEADLSRLGLIGWSHGAWTTMEWLHDPLQTQILRETDTKLTALIFIYPYCGTASVIHQKSWPAAAPILIVTAERDRTVCNRPTERLAQDLSDLGLAVSLVTMPGVEHAFDLFYRKFFNAKQTRELEREVLRFLEKEMNS
jgi:dienelactone hydrolase